MTRRSGLKALAWVVGVVVVASVGIWAIGLPTDLAPGEIRSAIVERTPNVADAEVHLSYVNAPWGPRNISVTLFMDDVTPQVVTEAVSRALLASWVKFPGEPHSVSVTVVDDPRGASARFERTVELDPEMHNLGSGSYGSRSFTTSAESLEERFGTQVEARKSY